MKEATSTNAVSPNPESVPVSSQPASQRRGIEYFIERDKTTKAEILWCLQTVSCHLSLSTAAKCVNAFKLMFEDSAAAKSLALGYTKIAYLIVHGLAPFFRKEILDDISKGDYFVVSFDESLNKISTKEQMDFFLRYWSKKKNEVISRYIGSQFLGHTTAADLLEAFKSEINANSLNLNRILQVSMDGPNVNLKFLKDLKENLKDNPDSPSPLEIGTCGLHTLHNAFKTSMKNSCWNIAKFLRDIHNVFYNVPARRADYIRLTGSERFPLKFCPVRWLQNQPVAERAIKMLPYLQKYCKKAEDEKIEPKSASYDFVKQSLKDKLIGPKLAFFESFAAEVEPFLRTYQTDKPMVPFLYTDLYNLIFSIMSKIVKSDYLEKYSSSLSKINLSSNDHLKKAQDLTLNHSVKAALRILEGVSQKDILIFKQDILRVYQNFCTKLLEKSPISYKLTKGLTFCDPALIVNNEKVACKRLTMALEIFVSHQQLSGASADRIEKYFTKLNSNPGTQNIMKFFSKNDDRLDHFWKKILVQNDANEEVKSFFKKIFIMSHGQASVERGFSVNKEILVENQHEKSLIAQRLVWDGLKCAGGIENIEITKNMIHCARNSHARYVEELEAQKKEKKEKQKQTLDKKRKVDTINTLEQKKRKIMEDAQRTIQILDEEIVNVTKF